jgi:hypothetical protein
MESSTHNLDAIAYYGADFIPDLIVGARGSELTTSNGKKILDWTSGQVSEKTQPETRSPPVHPLKCQVVLDGIPPRPLPP